jgi:hypothetical protein
MSIVRLAACSILLSCATHLAAADSVLLDPTGKQPRVAIAADHSIHILYGAGTALRLRSSTDGGATFSPAVTIATEPGLMLGMRRGPQIAASGDVLIAAAVAATTTNPGDSGRGDILAWKSSDRGATWTGPVTVNDRAASAREGLFSLAAGSKDTVWAVWLDARGGSGGEKGAQVRAALSTDQGGEWSDSLAIYQAPAGSVCPCCQPQVAADDHGDVAIMWRNLITGDRDMYLRMSTDHGGTFTPAEKLGTGTWPLNACPMDGGGLAIANDHVTAVWRRAGALFATDLTRDHPDAGAEIPLGDGKNGAVALSGATVIRVWQNAQGIQLQRGNQPALALGTGTYPTVATTTDGSAVVAWDGGDGVRVAVVR